MRRRASPSRSSPARRAPTNSLRRFVSLLEPALRANRPATTPHPMPTHPAAHHPDRRVRDSALLRADWPAPPGVRALTTLRRGLEVGISRPPFDSFNLGARCGDDPAAVAHNREALDWIAELPSPPCWLRQVHGTRVWRFDAPAAHEVEADAAVTDAPGVVLAVLTADCLPVVLAARDGSEVAVAHAGWRGLAAGVLEATVAAMRTSPA